MKNTIRLDITHPDKSRVEYFLSKVDDELEPVPFDAGELSGADDIIAGFKFRLNGISAFVTVIFTDSYCDAAKIEAANLTTRPEIRWTINGGILFGVESDDEEMVSGMLSWFAGKE